MPTKIEQQHFHNGVDQPKINPKHLLGFPIYKKETLDFTASQGTMVIRNKTSDSTYYLAVYLDGVWKEVELTSIAS